MKFSYIYIKMLIVVLFSSIMVMSADAKPKKRIAPANIEEMLKGVKELSPAFWAQGMPFVYLNDYIDLTLVPEVPSAEYDSIPQKGSIWFYDSMVSEEDWMGQQLLQLRFLSPQGRAYRFSTGRPMSAVSDTTYHPVISSIYPRQIIADVDSLFRAQTLYILLNDDRLTYPADTTSNQSHEKFVPVTIDSVCFGTEISPIRFYFHSENESGWADTSLPNVRELSSSTPISRFFSVVDPYLQHPDITPDIWEKIRWSQVQIDMTIEEVRLSWGRPSKVERAPSRSGMIELWYYSNNRILQFWDGRLNKIGIL